MNGKPLGFAVAMPIAFTGGAVAYATIAGATPTRVSRLPRWATVRSRMGPSYTRIGRSKSLSSCGPRSWRLMRGSSRSSSSSGARIVSEMRVWPPLPTCDEYARVSLTVLVASKAEAQSMLLVIFRLRAPVARRPPRRNQKPSNAQQRHRPAKSHARRSPGSRRMRRSSPALSAYSAPASRPR